MIKAAVIGCGQWGPNYIRIFSQLNDVKPVKCSDLDQGRLAAIKEAYPQIEAVEDYQAIIDDDAIDAVCIATPTNTHFRIAKAALESGKHVLCEKPLTLDVKEAEELYALAKVQQRVLMVGHVFLFNPGIVWLKEFIDSGELGEIYYAYSTRTNLGPFRYDVNALWDLAPHDISVFNYFFGSQPLAVSARGQNYLSDSLEDVAFATLDYQHNVTANVHVSWLDPRKVRQLTVVGDKKMVVWDDLDVSGPVKVFDKFVEKTSRYYETYGEFQLLSREGSVTMPKVPAQEPLKAQCQFFCDCINKKNHVEKVDAQKGIEVVRALMAIQLSMDEDGKRIAL